MKRSDRREEIGQGTQEGATQLMRTTSAPRSALAGMLSQEGAEKHEVKEGALSQHFFECSTYQECVCLIRKHP